jgi:hypothetical protein
VTERRIERERPLLKALGYEEPPEVRAANQQRLRALVEELAAKKAMP